MHPADPSATPAIAGPGAGPRRLLVLGPPRGGTTWIANVLGSVPDARLVHEPDNEVTDPFALVAKAGLGRYPVLGPEATAEQYRELWRAAFEHGRRSVHPGNRALAAALPKLPSHLRDDILVGRLDDRRARALLATARLVGRPRDAGDTAPMTIVKSVHAAFAAELITAVADPQVVVIRRHPLSVMASWIGFGWKPLRLEERPEMIAAAGIEDIVPFRPRTIDQHRAISYAVLHRQFDGLLGRHPDWVVADHEHICGDPDVRYRELFAALDLPWSDATERQVHAADTPGTGYEPRRVASQEIDSWRRRLDASTVDDLLEVFEHYGVAVRGTDTAGRGESGPTEREEEHA